MPSPPARPAARSCKTLARRFWAAQSGLELGVLHQVKQEYSALMDEGKQLLGTQALMEYYLRPETPEGK